MKITDFEIGKKYVHKGMDPESKYYLLTEDGLINDQGRYGAFAYRAIISSDWEEYQEPQELKPCPFCGSNDIKIDILAIGTCVQCCITCQKCYAKSPEIAIPREIGKTNEEWATLLKTKNIEAWNNRDILSEDKMKIKTVLNMLQCLNILYPHDMIKDYLNKAEEILKD